MASASFDPNQSKIGRGQIWDSAAQGYRIWWPHIEKAAQSLSNRLIELAEIRPGQRILDIATGIGEPALTADIISFCYHGCSFWNNFHKKINGFGSKELCC
jgi:protein-L-isoaspartate O-methyltransferase